MESGCRKDAVSFESIDWLDSVINMSDASYMNMFLSTWILLLAGLICALPMIHLRVKEHTEIADEAL